MCSVSGFFQGCAGCKSPPSVPPTAPFDVEIHDIELCSVLKAQEEGARKDDKNLTETAMDEAQPEDDDDDDEAEEKRTKPQDSNHDMTAAEPRAASEDVNEKSHMTH